jgi:hypothetical protein
MKRLFPDHFVPVLLSGILLLCSGEILGQVKVSKITSPGDLAGKKGIVYNLPRTVIHVDVTVSKIQQFPGPLAAYAGEFLGVSDVIVKNQVEYRFENAEMIFCTEPDPGQYYIVEKEEKGQGEMWVGFGPPGQTITVETFPKEATPKGFSQWDNGLYQPIDTPGLYSKYSASATRVLIDTIIRRISIDTLTIEEKVLKRSLVAYPDRDKAQETVDRIRRIEDDIYNLLIGYQETPYSKETVEFMYNKLQAERQEYMALFTGVTVRESLVFHYNIVPDPSSESHEYVITGFSPATGLVEADDENKLSVVIQVGEESLPLTESGKDQSPPGIVYRIPVHLPVSLEYKGKELVSGTYEIKQLGALFSLPPEFKKVELNLETGTVRTLVIE